MLLVAARFLLVTAVLVTGMAVLPAVGMRPALAQTADPVIIRSGAHSGYGRIVLQWNRPVDYTAEIIGDQLVVRFSDPLNASLRGVLSPVSDYVSDGFFDPDGHTVAFVLRDDFQVRAFTVDNNVVLDIFDKPDASQPANTPPAPDPEPAPAPAPAQAAAQPSAQASAPTNTQPPAQSNAPARQPAASPAVAPRANPAPAPSATSSTASATATPASASAAANPATPELSVRVGRHPTFYRLVFDWPQRTDYSLSGPEGAQDIAFNTPARIDAADVTRRLPEGVNLRQNGTDPLNVAIETNPPRALRHFRSGNRVVVDVMGAQAEPQGDQQGIQGAANTRTANAAPAATPARPAAPETPAAPANGAPRPVTPPANEHAAAPQPAGGHGAAPAPADAGHGAIAANDHGAAPASAPAAVHGAAQPAAGVTVPPRESIGDLTVTVTQDANRLSLGFPFGQPGGAAIWARAGFLWMVFDVRANLDLSRVRQDAAQVIGVIEQMDSAYATVLRMTIPDGVGLYTTPSANGDWTVTLQQGTLQPVEKLGPTIELDDETRARLVVPLQNISPTIPVDDPEVGDHLRVVPTREMGYGIETALRYPDFEVLPSVQGVVVAPVNDGIQVRARDDGEAVVVTAAEGLNISPEGARLLASATGVRSRAGDGREGLIFDLEDWRRGGLDNYNPVLRKLRRELAESGEEHRNKARLNIAQYYMANGLGPEANAVISTMEDDDPLIAQKLQFRALKAAVKFLDHDFAEADRLLEDERLREIPEMKLWRAVTLAARGRPNEGARDLMDSVHILSNYPPELLSRLGPLAAEQALIVGNPKAGMDLIEKMLETEGFSDGKIKDVQYLKGVFEEEAGDYDQAVATWDEVADGDNRKARAHAIFDRTELQLRLDRMTLPDAIEQLEKLRFAWRGDAFEMALLRRLGELQIQNKQYRDGLNTLRRAAIFFPNNPETQQITDLMHNTFASLYLGDEINNISAIKAVALYDEFRELTPAGEKGDELIRRLADRMVDVELFDRAEALLEHQVDFRLKGAEKARVAARLALVYLLDGKPEDTIRVLDESNVPGLTPELEAQRRHLRARALLDTNRGDEAMASLDGDFSKDAELLRIEHYRATKDYLAAADTFQRLVGDDPGKMVDEFGNERARYVLNWAVNLAMAGQERTLSMLKRRYGVVMAQGPYAEAFNLITSSPTQGLIDYRTLASKVDEVENFQGFLANYRDQLEKSQLSAIN